MSRRILVAGIGNIFFGDDGFGVEVVRHLHAGPALPPDVEVVDVGIRGIHLVYELLDGCELLILVDLAPRGETPGTVSVIETSQLPTDRGIPVLDAHGLAPHELLEAVSGLGASPGRTLIVACEPADVNPGIGLSPAVAAAVPEAVRLVNELVAGGAGVPGLEQALAEKE